MIIGICCCANIAEFCLSHIVAIEGYNGPGVPCPRLMHYYLIGNLS